MDLDYGLADVYANYTDYNDTEWHLFSATQTSSGSYAYYNLYIYAPALSACPGGSYFEIGAFQIEQKGYATPFVGDGQFARPASINLMIHGDVGTGTSFEDSSPSKHTITTVGNTTHSAAQSKFSGGSVYFDGTGDYLSVPTDSSWTIGSNDYSVDMWIKTTDGLADLISAFNSASPYHGWLFGIGFSSVTDGKLAFYQTDASSGNETFAWNHISQRRHVASCCFHKGWNYAQVFCGWRIGFHPHNN